MEKGSKHGNPLEPIEKLFVEIPNDCLGNIMENLSGRKAQITNMNHVGNQVSVEALVPMRGLIGFETDLVNSTKGMGVMSHLFHEYGPDCGEIAARKNGSLVSMDNGEATNYALNMVQERGRLMVEAGDAIYVGMIVGENARENDIPVNPVKEKRLTNMRSQGDGKGIQLAPPMKLSLERALEYIDVDEYVEATPKNLRLRKKVLDEGLRRRTEKTRVHQVRAGIKPDSKKSSSNRERFFCFEPQDFAGDRPTKSMPTRQTSSSKSPLTAKARMTSSSSSKSTPGGWVRKFFTSSVSRSCE